MNLHKNIDMAKLSPVKRRVASMVAALVGAKAGAALFGSPLIGANIGRKTTTSMLDSLTNKRADELAEQLLTNPEKFAELGAKLKVSAADMTVKQKKEAIMELLAVAGVKTGIVSSEINKEDER